MRRRLALVLVLLLLAGSCGDDAVPGDVVGAPSPTELPPTELPPTGVPPTEALESVVLVSDLARSEPVSDAPIGELVTGFNNAGFGLLAQQPEAENFVFSPMSIGHALLMARAAADEPTGAAIDTAFGLPADLSAHQAWNAIDRQIVAASTGEVIVTIADRIWPRSGVQPSEAWLDLLAAEHGAGTEALDFAGDPEGSREVINGWIGEQTEGLIPELLPRGVLNEQTLLVLTDAVYFKAPWQRPFGKYGPVEGDFARLDGSTVPVSFLQELELEDRRGVGDGFVGAELPYAGSEFSMLVIVPDEGRFGEVRSRLSQDLLDEIDASFATGPYELLLPPWKTTSALDLLPWLGAAGAAPGSYPGIDPEAFLGGAVHGADITVDEWGTVAAAATGLAFPESGPPESELTVAADKPFLYVIRHRATGLVLFAGQVTDPTA